MLFPAILVPALQAKAAEPNGIQAQMAAKERWLIYVQVAVSAQLDAKQLLNISHEIIQLGSMDA